MTAKDDEAADVVKTEIAKGQQDDVLEDYPRSEREKTREKSRSKMSASRTAERAVPRVAAIATSVRIRELARPTRQRVLNTLNEKALTLPPAFVDNLISIIEAESCLTPEEAARVRRRKERRARKATRLPPPLAKKRPREIAEDTELDRDATTCQYLMAEHFVKSILGYRCGTPKKEVREIADVIMRRLTSLDGYADAKNGDRATRQLRLLADVVACWMAEILVEVAEVRQEALEEYCEKRRMRMMEVDDDNETDSETEAWGQIEQTKEEIKQEGTNYETKRRDKPTEEKNEGEHEPKGENKEKDEEEERKKIKIEDNPMRNKNEGVNEQKGGNNEGEREEVKRENKEDEATKKEQAKEKEQLDEKEAKNKNEEDKTIKEKQRNDENVEKEKVGKEMHETEKKEGKEKAE